MCSDFLFFYLNRVKRTIFDLLELFMRQDCLSFKLHLMPESVFYVCEVDCCVC